MVDENLNVWLIEVNASPSMECKGQAVLGELIEEVLTDLTKVVIDVPQRRNADTGGFKLVHRAWNEV